MSDREKGWYWVKQTGFAFWGCCQWNGYAWHGIWIESVPDSGFSEIGQRIPSPGEPWQIVPLEITNDMIEHGVIDSGYLYAKCNTEEAWRYMLAAAPKPGGN